jgi:SpoVK/Ycf46/Vps4 family AAA+-type ATPase
MKTILNLIKGKASQKFPKNTDALWVNQSMYKSLVPSDKYGLAYVKIYSNEPLKGFTLFCKLETLSKDFSTDAVFIMPSLLPKNKFLDDSTPIDIEYLDLDSLQEAQSVVLKLPEDMVLTWAEDESEFSKRHFKTKNKLAYWGQSILLQTGTQKSEIAVLTKVFPDKDKNEAFKITQDTVVTLEGLPDNQQKVVNFEKIGGLDYLIERIREIIQIPLTYPQILDSFNIQPPKGLLLYGPPGNGKTMIARAIANSLGAKFVSIEGPELNSKYVGVAEQRLREKFEEASQYKNSVLFIDEIDSIAKNREHENSESHQIDMVATLLNLMDGIRSAKGLFVIGATNRLNAVDSALRRPGRFELEYEIGLPNQLARLEILNKYIPWNAPLLIDSSINEEFVKYLSEVTNGYSGADLVSLYRLSVIRAIRRNMSIDTVGKIKIEQTQQTICLKSDDFQQTLKEITPTSLRGIDLRREALNWNELILSKTVREELESIDNLIEKAVKSSYNLRPSFMNVILKGPNRSGKKTIMQSYAKHFKYEMIEFNLMDYLSDTFSKTISEMENKIQRCKQVAPCIFFIENVESFPELKLLLAKLSDMLECIGNRQSVLTVIAITKLNHLVALTGFEKHIEIPLVTKQELSLLAEKYKIELSKLMDWKELPIGIIISKIEELLIIGR